MNAILHALMPPKIKPAEPTRVHVCEDDDDFDVADRKHSKRSNQFSANCIKLTYRGETLTVVEWAERAGVTRQTIYKRRKLGWPVAQALGFSAHRDRRSRRG